MNNQRKIGVMVFLFIAAMLFVSGNVFAQQQRGENRQPKTPNINEVARMVGELSTKLDLSELQKKEVTELFTKHFNEIKLEVGNKNGQRKSREEMDKVKRDFENQIKKLLIGEQKTKFTEFMSKQGPGSRQNNSRR